jgi:hypothetical protein
MDKMETGAIARRWPEMQIADIISIGDGPFTKNCLCCSYYLEPLDDTHVNDGYCGYWKEGRNARDVCYKVQLARMAEE